MARGRPKKTVQSPQEQTEKQEQQPDRRIRNTRDGNYVRIARPREPGQ